MELQSGGQVDPELCASELPQEKAVNSKKAAKNAQTRDVNTIVFPDDYSIRPNALRRLLTVPLPNDPSRPPE